MQDSDFHEARERVRERRGFYSHLMSYLVINAALLVINLIASPLTLWFYWVTIFWGIGLIFHAIDTLIIRGKYFGREWEERKTSEFMEEQEKRRRAG